MIDNLGRDISYVRISVTDRCNLKCVYCAPGGEKGCKALADTQIIMLARAFSELGMTKIRLTGGEPLIRADILNIIRGVSSLPGIVDLPLTTNGMRLLDMTKDLYEAGLRRINVSLDSLKPERFAEITGVDAFQMVMDGILRAMDTGISVKLNTVLIRGVNDDEIDDFIELTRDNKYAVRFIELMPIGRFGEDNRDKVVPHDEVIAKRPYLIRAPELDDAVSESYTIEGYKGKIGFISPMTHKFCGVCNRVRVTADGKLKTCLGRDSETDIMPWIETEDFDGLKEAIREAVYNKPKGHGFEAHEYSSKRGMSRIGG